MPDTRRKILSGFLIAGAALAALSCGERSATGPRNIAPGDPARSISDGAQPGGNTDVWFLPPMVPNPSGKPGYGDPFAPNLPVQIRVRDMTAAGTPVVNSPTAATMSLVDEFYGINWDTKATTLDPTHTFRIEVAIGTQTLAWGDVDLVSNGSELKNVATGQYIGLVDGRTLPIKVRIEQGWNCVNNASCVSQVVPATIPPTTSVTVKTNDGKDWITFHGDANGNWNSLNQPVVVTVEDVTSQLGGTAAGCAQGYTRMVIDGHCMKITTDPAITLTTSAVVCMTLASYQLDWKMLKFDVAEAAHFLDDPPLGQCPTSGPTIGSTSTSRNPLLRLAWSFGSALRRFVTPTIAYAFDAGVGGTVLPGDGFSYFAPGHPARIVITAGNNQSVPVSTTLPVAPTVQILSTHHGSNPVGGAIVTCSITAGGGTLSVPSGQATEGPTGTYTCPNWTLGSVAGANTLKVTANILDPNTADGNVVFSETATTTPFIASLTLSSSSVVLDGTPVNYTALLRNPSSSPQAGMFVQGYLIQGAVNKAAGGTNTTCAQPFGTLPTGDCTQVSIVSASNANGGAGNLVAGAASFLLELRQTTGQTSVLLDSKSVPVTISNLPNPVLALKNFDPEPGSTTYNLTVTNRAVYPNTLFNASPNLPPCGANTSASRTWVDIYNGATNEFIFGFCSLGSSADLDGIWFAVPTGNSPPPSVYIRMTDRLTGNVYQSNTITLNTAPVLAFDHVTHDTGGDTYWLKLTNGSIYNNQMFVASPNLPPCGLNTSSSRTWLDIYQTSDNAYIYGFCSFSSSSDLSSFWFFVPTNGSKPANVYITLTDRLLNTIYTSNSVAIP
jgi:hypothetical protein